MSTELVLPTPGGAGSLSSGRAESPPELAEVGSSPTSARYAAGCLCRGDCESEQQSGSRKAPNGTMQSHPRKLQRQANNRHKSPWAGCLPLHNATAV